MYMCALGMGLMVAEGGGGVLLMGEWRAWK